MSEQQAREPAYGDAHAAMTLTMVMRGFFGLAAPYWNGDRRLRAWALTGAILALGVLQVTLAIRLNLWSADLFNAVEQRSGSALLAQMGIFAGIVIGTMLVNAIHLRTKRSIQLEWRQSLSESMIAAWMHDGNQFRLEATAGGLGNPDARIAEDVRIATEAAVELANSLFYCVLLLVSFVAILWTLSGVISFEIGSVTFLLSGHMVWLAFLYAGAGSLLATYIGRHLVHAADWRQTVEANFRYGLVRGRDNAESIAMARSESDERRSLSKLFDAVAAAWRSQTQGLQRLILFTSAYSTLAGFFPILVSAPRFLAGEISLGGLMQTAQAFQQATGALSWPVDNFARLAELRASLERIIALDADLRTAGTVSGEFAHITRTAGLTKCLQLRHLTLTEPDGRPITRVPDLEISAGERVMLSGDARTIAVLCKAIGGVWPWGSGEIVLPAGQIFVSPATPYLPGGTLRQVVSYPARTEADHAGAIEQCLTDVGLGYLLGRIDGTADWEQALSPQEVQQIGVARLLLHHPEWILMDRATSAMTEAAEQKTILMLAERLPMATIIVADPRPWESEIFTRRITINRSSAGDVVMQDLPGSGRDNDFGPQRQNLMGKLLNWTKAGFGGN